MLSAVSSLHDAKHLLPFFFFFFFLYIFRLCFCSVQGQGLVLLGADPVQAKLKLLAVNVTFMPCFVFCIIDVQQRRLSFSRQSCLFLSYWCLQQRGLFQFLFLLPHKWPLSASLFCLCFLIFTFFVQLSSFGLSVRLQLRSLPIDFLPTCLSHLSVGLLIVPIRPSVSVHLPLFISPSLHLMSPSVCFFYFYPVVYMPFRGVTQSLCSLVHFHLLPPCFTQMLSYTNFPQFSSVGRWETEIWQCRSIGWEIIAAARQMKRLHIRTVLFG